MAALTEIQVALAAAVVHVLLAAVVMLVVMQAATHLVPKAAAVVHLIALHQTPLHIFQHGVIMVIMELLTEQQVY